MPNDETSRTWWQTVPGMITAFAGLLTAIGGLLTILLQAGIIGPDGRVEHVLPRVKAAEHVDLLMERLAA